MRKRVLALVVAVAVLPTLALAAQPLLVRFNGHDMPMHEIVRTVQTGAGPVQVRSWSWQGPDGAGTVRVSRSDGVAMPGWALQQMRLMQVQMAQMQAQMQMLSAGFFPPLATASPLQPTLLQGSEPVQLPILVALPQVVMKVPVFEAVTPIRVVFERLMPVAPRVASPSQSHAAQGIRV